MFFGNIFISEVLADCFINFNKKNGNSVKKFFGVLIPFIWCQGKYILYYIIILFYVYIIYTYMIIYVIYTHIIHVL